jgi:hypothetical protein
MLDSDNSDTSSYAGSENDIDWAWGDPFWCESDSD